VNDQSVGNELDRPCAPASLLGNDEAMRREGRRSAGVRGSVINPWQGA